MEVMNIAIGDLMPDPNQPRKTFLKDEIERMKDSVVARGVLVPLRVMWDGEREKWRIIVGECRWRAAMLAGRTHVPCLPVEGEVSETDILTDQILENSVRNSLKPLDFARAICKLKTLRRCTAQQLSKELGISGAEITRTESLLDLPDNIQTLVDDGRVAESIAYLISRHPDEQAQQELAAAVAAKKMKRTDVENAVREAIGGKSVKPEGSRLTHKLDNGVNITLAAGRPLTKGDITAAISYLKDAAKRLPTKTDPEPSLVPAS